MSSFHTSVFPLVALALAVPACASTTASEASESEEFTSDLRIKPTDNETLSRFTVTTPAGWTLPINPAEDATVTYRGAAAPLNLQQRLKDGDGALYVTSKFDVGVNAGNVNLVKGTASTFDLGAMKPTFTASSDAASTLKREFGPTPSLRVFYTGAGIAEAQVYGQALGNGAFWNGAPQRALLAPPGAYRFSWTLPILLDTSKSLAGGESATVNIAPSDQRATIIVKKPAARELPDAPAGNCHLATRTFLVHRRVDNAAGVYGEPPSYDQKNTALGNVPVQDGSNTYSTAYDYVTSWAALPVAGDTTVRVFPFANSEAPNHYELVVNNVATTLALKPGDTKTIQLERLDVDDVAVTKENGEVYTVRGTFQLFSKGPNNSWIPFTSRQDCSNGAGVPYSLYTNSGIDVMPGTYRLIISYSTAEGARTQDQTVTVP